MKIAFVGDIAFLGNYNNANNEFLDSIQELKLFFEQFDYVVGNLEAPFTLKMSSIIPKSMHLKSNPENVEILKILNINIVSLANNHIYDYGRKGFDSTIEILKKNNILWFGVNEQQVNLQKGNSSMTLLAYNCLSTNGNNYSLFPFKKGVNTLTYKNVSTDLKNCKLNNSLPIILTHWGLEHTKYPNLEHINFFKKIAVDNDFTLLGSHPHVIQGYMKSNNSYAIFSLGNFLFGDYYSKIDKKKLSNSIANRRGLIYSIEVIDNIIMNNKTYLFEYDDDENKFKIHEDCFSTEDLSTYFQNAESKMTYDSIRHKEFKKILEQRFGKKTILFYIKKFNYYNVLNYVLSKIRLIIYKIVKRNW